MPPPESGHTLSTDLGWVFVTDKTHPFLVLFNYCKLANTYKGWYNLLIKILSLDNWILCCLLYYIFERNKDGD